MALLDPGQRRTYKGAMFGFSLQKLLVLAAVIAAVWYGFKYLSQLDRTRKAEVKRRAKEGVKAPGRRAAKQDDAAEPEDMVLCPVCQAYVPARGSSNCGRPDCPY